MLKENRIWFIAFGILLIYILYLQQCKGGKVENTNTIQTIYKFDTIVREFPVYYPTERFVVLPSDTIKIPYTDTNYCKKISNDYLTTRYYADTLRNDSVDLYIKSEVTNNRIQRMYGAYKLKFPIITTNIIEENRIKVFLGGNVGTDFKNFYTGLSVTVLDKKEFGYRMSASFSPTGGLPRYELGVLFKLRFPRKKKLIKLL
jgi:hypothetical protein